MGIQGKKLRLSFFIAIMLVNAIALVMTGVATGSGTDAQVDVDPLGTLNQNEISLTLIPGNTPGQPQLLLAAYNDQPFAGGPGIGVSYSTDGGANWVNGQLPYPAHSSGALLVEAFDPTATVDTQGNVFVAHIATDANWASGPSSGLYVHKSVNGGASWQTPVAVAENGTAAAPQDPNYRLNDRCQMTADRFIGSSYTDNIYVAWVEDRGWNMFQPYSDVYFAYSNDGGATFNIAAGTSSAFPGRINDENASRDMGNMPVPAVAPDGTVYVSWMDYNVQTGGAGTIYLDSSADGGASWGTDKTVATIDLPSLNLNPLTDNTRAKGAPVLKVSPGNSSELYMVYAEDPDRTLLLDGPDDADIRFIKSTDGGATWSTPITLNDDGTANDQILPWMDVKPDGTIDVGWYDRRGDANDSKWDVYMAKSADGGLSFSSNTSINDQSFASPVRYGSTEGWLGEYMGLAVDSSHVYVAWTSSVSDSLGDIYFDKLDNNGFPCTTGKPSLSIASFTPYWQSYANYTAGLLNVSYSIQNSGGASAYNVAITGSTATSSVVCATGMPVSIGVIAAGATATADLQYNVPTGVVVFVATVNAGTDDECGNSYTYP